MLSVIGYILFILVRVFGATWVAVLLMPVSVLLGLLVSILPRTSPAATQKIAAMFGGVCDGLFTLGLALLFSWLFSCSFNWLIGIGMACTLFAAGKIMNARVAVPASIITVLAMSYLLVF